MPRTYLPENKAYCAPESAGPRQLLELYGYLLKGENWPLWFAGWIPNMHRMTARERRAAALELLGLGTVTSNSNAAAAGADDLEHTEVSHDLAA